MKILEENKKEKYVKIKIENSQDLWYVAKIIKGNDIVYGKSFRAVKFNNEEERKPVFVKLLVEKTEFKQKPLSLRVSGVILDGKPEEFIQRGRHHSIEINEDYILTLQKDEWKEYEKNLLKSALEDSRKDVVQVLLIDEKKALIVDINPYGYEEKFETDLPSGKRWDEKEKERIKKIKYNEILQGLKKQAIIIVAGPGFEKELMKEFLEEKGYKTKLAEASYAEITSVRELFENGTIDNVIGEARISKEAKYVNDVLISIYKNELGCFKIDEIKKAVEEGIIDYIIVNDKLLANKEIVNILKDAEEKKAKVFVISSEHEWGEKLKGLGGIAAKLRFKIS